MVAFEDRRGFLRPEDLSGDFKGKRAAYTYNADSRLANRGGYGGDGIGIINVSQRLQIHRIVDI